MPKLKNYNAKIIEVRITSKLALDEFYFIAGQFFSFASYDTNDYLVLDNGSRVYRTSPLKLVAIVTNPEDEDQLQDWCRDLAKTRTLLKS